MYKTISFFPAPYAKSARILTLMSIPGAVLFVFAADFAHMSESTIGAPFVFTYLVVSLMQLCMLLYIAHVITHLMWKLKIDPDNATIPYLTALGDLIGSLLLLGAFSFLRAIGHDYGGAEQAESGSAIEKFLLEFVFAGHYEYFNLKVNK
jgi:solute carrier family 41